jgi:hypothetical protein
MLSVIVKAWSNQLIAQKMETEMKINNFLTIIGLMSLIVSGIPNLGMATTITTTYLGGAYGYDTGSIEPGPSGSTQFTNNVGFGGDLQTLDTASAPVNFAKVGSNFITWCVDIYHWDATNSIYTVGTATLVNSSTLIKLANEDYSSVKDQYSSAAFQLAVWAIMFGNPDSNGIYQVSSSTFTAEDFTPNSTAIATANDWLKDINIYNGPMGDYQLSYLSDDTSENTQDMIVFTPVPEPSTLFLLGVGIASVAIYGKRRKNSKVI